MASSNKTVANDADVMAFLKAVENQQRREDSLVVLEMMQKITKEKPVMWGNSIVGFGQYHYKYASGREGDNFLTGFSPRKQSLTVYVMDGFKKRPELLEKLGKCKTSVSCLYINKLADIDLKVLRQIIKESASYLKKNQSAC